MSVSSIGNGSNAIQNALLGIQRGMAGLARDSETVAHATTVPGGSDQTMGALVDAQQQRLSVEASARAFSITDQALGTLLDVTA